MTTRPTLEALRARVIEQGADLLDRSHGSLTLQRGYADEIRAVVPDEPRILDYVNALEEGATVRNTETNDLLTLAASNLVAIIDQRLAELPPLEEAWSDSNPPWRGKADIPTGVKVHAYAEFSDGGVRSFKQTMDAIRSAAREPYYVRLPEGTVEIPGFGYGAGTAGYGAGYQDVSSTKLWGGFIGAGADKTFVDLASRGMSAAQLAAVAKGQPSPVQLSALYAGGRALPIPTVFSGITFRGRFQQTTALAGLTGTAPAPYRGIYMPDSKPGSTVQFCRFQGFGFTAKNAPPYECGALNTKDSAYTIRGVEIDGRLALDAARPVASGGFMPNYDEAEARMIDVWIHHTRRSGLAIHDHAVSEGGNARDLGDYYLENVQVERIADTSDGYAGTSLGFAGVNVEEVKLLTMVRPRLTASYSHHQHVVIATTNGNAMGVIRITDPRIGDEIWGGCLAVRFIKQPNSYGTSPYYTAYQKGGLGALPISVTAGGKPLTPVLSTQFKPSTHKPDTHYVTVMA